MKNKTLKYSELTRYNQSPFNEEIIKRTTENTKQQVKYFNKQDEDKNDIPDVLQSVESKEMIQVNFKKQVKVDSTQFVKIFISTFAAFFDLPSIAIKVFGYIIEQLPINKDQIIFKMNACKQKTGIVTHQPIYKALVALEKSNIIARSDQSNILYINPLIVFNGNLQKFTQQITWELEEKQETK